MRADIVSTFFQELRKELDEEQKRRGDGSHIDISVMVLGSDENNLQYGVDIRRLVKEKLLDVVYVYQFDFGATKEPRFDTEYFRSACTEQGVPWFPTVDPPYDLTGQLPHATELYQSGASGLTFWDAGGVDTYKWAVQSRLGHANEVKWRSENMDLEHPPRKFYFFKWWGAQRMDVRFPPYWGG
jgi:hypothetical protein